VTITREVAGVAGKAKRNSVLRNGARLGYAISGLLHLLIAWIALQVAGSGSGRSADQSGALRTLAGSSMGRLTLWVAVVGFVALGLWQLAIGLAARGHRVAAVDADVWGFSLPRMLGIDRPPGLVDDVIVPPSAHGVRLVSMGFFARDDQAVIWRGPMLHKALEQFLTDVHWGNPDVLVVDLPPGTGDVALSMAQLLPHAEVVVVTTPQPAAQRVAQRSAAMAEKVDLPVVGVIENMSWFTGDDGKRYEIFGSGGGRALADTLGVPLLGQVPLVSALREGGDTGRPISVTDPDSEAAQVFTAIAERLDAATPRRIRHPELRIG